MTHADLFLENPVKLPFLNIELPLLAFFFLAPILFLIVHAYTLVHLVSCLQSGGAFRYAPVHVGGCSARGYAATAILRSFDTLRLSLASDFLAPALAVFRLAFRFHS